MRILLCFVFTCLFAIGLYSQNPATDSLKLILVKTKVDTSKVSLLMQIAVSFRGIKIDSGFWYYQKAADLAHQIKYTKGELKAQERIAELLNLTSNYSRSLELSLRSLKVAEQLRDTENIFWIKREIMRTHGHLENNSQVLEDARNIKALVHSGYFKDPRQIKFYSLVGYINWFGSAYEGLHQFDSARYYRSIAYRLSKELNEPQGLALSTLNLGDIYSLLNINDSALLLYKTSIAYAIISRRNDIVASAKLGIARLFKETQSDSAFYYAEQALVGSTKSHDLQGQMDASMLLSNMYKTRGKFDSAYKYLNSYITLKDSVFNQNTLTQIQSLTFGEALRQKQIEQDKKDAKLQYESRVKIFSLAAGLAIILIIALILYRNNRIKQEANGKLKEQQHKTEKALEELKATQAQLIQSEKMASLGELTAGIAHEIQNPLNFVNNFSEVSRELVEELKQELKEGNNNQAIEISDDLDKNLEKISHHGKRADAIVKGMLLHSRNNTSKKELTNINALADEYLRLSYHGLRAKDKTFNAILETSFDERIEKINVVPQEIGRVFLNLFTNAFYSVTEKKKQQGEGYQPTVSVATRKVSDEIEIIVKDNGTGIPQKVLDKIYHPFFTTKPTGEGTGLGLSLSYDIITKAHGGEIEVETKEGEFAEFIITLPLK